MPKCHICGVLNAPGSKTCGNCYATLKDERAGLMLDLTAPEESAAAPDAPETLSGTPGPGTPGSTGSITPPATTKPLTPPVAPPKPIRVAKVTTVDMPRDEPAIVDDIAVPPAAPATTAAPAAPASTASSLRERKAEQSRQRAATATTAATSTSAAPPSTPAARPRPAQPAVRPAPAEYTIAPAEAIPPEPASPYTMPTMQAASHGPEALAELPFLGYKVNGANDSPRGCGAFSYPDNPLVYHVQERFDMDVSMAEDNISREKKIQGHVLILPPEYKRFKASEVEFFDTLVDPPAPFTSEPEVYIGKIGHDGLPVNYGNLVWGQGENRTTVIPIVSKVPYRDVKAGMAIDNSLNINASWDHVHALFESDPLIVHDLDRTRDKFRWDVPVEIRVEIENPILCTIRALESSVNWQGFAAREDSFKDHVTLEDKPAEAKLRSLIDWYLWGDMKNLGELSRIIRNIQMAQVHVVIQNNTSMQLVESRLNNVDFSIEFSNFIKDLMITGNVAFISSEPRGVVDLQENRLVFQRFNLDTWNQVRIAVGISWEVLAKLDTLRFVIRGEYDRAPSILGSMYYTTPMGFPCVMTPDGPAWNPGHFVASRPKDPHPDVEFVVDKAALARGAQSTSTFVQTINLNLDAVKLKLQSLKSIFEASFGDIESLQGDLDKFYRIFDKAIDLGERVKNDGGDRRE